MGVWFVSALPSPPLLLLSSFFPFFLFLSLSPHDNLLSPRPIPSCTHCLQSGGGGSKRVCARRC